MAMQNGRNFRLQACAVCSGDAFLDLSEEPEWRCLQCGRTIPAELTAAGLAVAGLGQRAA